MLLTIAERMRDVLVPFLLVGTALLAAGFAFLIVQRLIRGVRFARRQELLHRYRSIVAEALAVDGRQGVALPDALRTRHREVAGQLILSTLRVVRGPQAAQAARIAEELGLSAAWRADLGARRWWRRAEAALALGLLRDRKSVRELIARLDDDDEQVRAAAIDALGQIGDTMAVPPLVARMTVPTRHERARLVQALRAFGEKATAPLVEYAAGRPADKALTATVLSFIGGASAAEALLEWTRDPDPTIRSAAWSALATVGVDDRAFYHAVKALDAAEPAVRAAAARALSRCGRSDASGYLAARLDDEWEVAAQSARALARLGEAGKAALDRRATGAPGLGQELARQVLWEGGHR